MNLTYYTATDRRCKASQLGDAIIAALQAAGVPVVPEVKLANNWVFDGAINGTRLLVEIHGDYWHGEQRPEVQQRDQRKQAWADEHNYLILTIWESEYQKNPEGEIARILSHYKAVRAFASEVEAMDRGPQPSTSDISDTDSRLPEWAGPFLEGLRTTRTVRGGCLKAGIHRSTYYEHMAANPLFAEAVRWAKHDAADGLFESYVQRGQTQSDRAAERAMALLNPETYGETTATRIELTGKDGGPVEVRTLTDAERAGRIAALFERARQRARAAAPEGGDQESADESGGAE